MQLAEWRITAQQRHRQRQLPAVMETMEVTAQPAASQMALVLTTMVAAAVATAKTAPYPCTTITLKTATTVAPKQDIELNQAQGTDQVTLFLCA